jgi:uncharacterized membrane protein YfcA
MFNVPDNFQWWFLLILFVFSFPAEVVGSTFGGGSFLTLLGLTAIVGLPLRQALFLDDASTIGMEAGVLTHSWPEFRADWRLVLFQLCPPITLGGVLGTYLLLTVPIEVIKGLMILALAVLLFYSFYVKPRQTKEQECQEQQQTTKYEKVLLFGVFFVIGIYNNLIGPGEGTYSKIALMAVKGTTFRQAHRLKSVAMTPIRIFALVVAIWKGYIVWPYLFVMLIATFLAGWVVTKYIVDRVPERIMIGCLAVVGVFFAAVMLFAY